MSGVISQLVSVTAECFLEDPNLHLFESGSQGGVHEFADSQFGHLFAVGANREHVTGLAV